MNRLNAFNRFLRYQRLILTEGLFRRCNTMLLFSRSISARFKRLPILRSIFLSAALRKIFVLEAEAKHFLELGDVERARQILYKCTRLLPESEDYRHFRNWSLLPALAVTEQQGFGREDIANDIFIELQKQQNEEARKRNLPLDNRLFFSGFWTSHIGHLAAIGAFVKRSILEGDLLRGITISLPPGRRPVNECLFSHWERYGIVTPAEALPVTIDNLQAYEKLIFTFEYPEGRVRPYWDAMADVHRDWDALGLPPLLQLSEAEEISGYKQLAELGVPRDAWFVCLHVRSSGFKTSHEKLHAPLNADIETYVPMIREITNRGGWIIRMGDPSVPKLAAMENVVDYAHSPARSGTMDIFLSARCCFYVGTSSGLGFVPPLFGTRCVFTNWFPVGTRPFQPKDIYIFKLHRSYQNKKMMPFAQTLSAPIGYIHSLNMLAKNGVTLLDNTSDEITEVVLEMYDQVIEGKVRYTGEDNRLQKRFDEIAKKGNCSGSARVGRSFLRRYEDLLSPPAAHGP